MPASTITTIRLSKQDRREIEDLMEEFGFARMAPLIRYAVRRLRDAKR